MQIVFLKVFMWQFLHEFSRLRAVKRTADPAQLGRTHADDRLTVKSGREPEYEFRVTRIGAVEKPFSYLIRQNHFFNVPRSPRERDLVSWRPIEFTVF